MDNISSFLGLVRKAGRVDIGEEPVGAACRSGKAYLLLLAADAADNSVRRATHFAGERIPILTVPLDKEALGLALGRPPCAMISISDVGFAAAMGKRLYALDPAIDPGIIERLEQKSVKTIQRRREKIAHEKNLLRGKKPPLSKVDSKKNRTN